MLTRRSRMLTAIALANKLARIIRAILTRKDVYRDSAGALC
jgi:transposase